MKLKWTEAALIADAAKYKTRTEWQKKSSSAYHTALKRGLIDVCCAHMSGNRSWTEAALIADAAKYQTRGEWKKKSSGAYSVAQRRGLLKVCCAHMQQVLTDWTAEMLIADAAEYQTRTEWSVKSEAAYSAAKARGLREVCCAHMIDGSPSDLDVVYIWEALGLRYNGERVYKIGVTSDRLGDWRIKQVAAEAGMECAIVAMVRVPERSATKTEAKLHAIGQNPKMLKCDGSTEFRALSDAELRECMGILYRDAVAA